MWRSHIVLIIVFFDAIRSLPCVILSGDLNAQHSEWGSFNDNTLGRHIVRALDIFREAMIMEDSKPTRDHQGSCLDLTIIFRPPHFHSCGTY